MKKYIIHLAESTERESNVHDIIQITGAEIFPAIRATNGAEGCFLSHLELYKKDPDESLVVFEDDCKILDLNILDLVNQYSESHDIIYFGVIYVWVAGSEPKIIKNFMKSENLNSWGTHAMWISAKARQAFLEYYNNHENLHKVTPVDHVWNNVQNTYRLKAWRPSNIYQYCKQIAEYKSTIQNANFGDYYLETIKKVNVIRSFRKS